MRGSAGSVGICSGRKTPLPPSARNAPAPLSRRQILVVASPERLVESPATRASVHQDRAAGCGKGSSGAWRRGRPAGSVAHQAQSGYRPKPAGTPCPRFSSCVAGCARRARESRARVATSETRSAVLLSRSTIAPRPLALIGRFPDPIARRNDACKLVGRVRYHFCRLDVLCALDALRRIVICPIAFLAKAEELPESFQFLL